MESTLGSATEARTTRCRLASCGSTGSSPSSSGAGSRPVSSTTSDRRDAWRRMADVAADQSVSTRLDSSGAMALTRVVRSSVGDAPTTRALVVRSKASRSTRSPARDASAASSNAASMAASRRGASPTRPADVRPVSRTSSRWRSRSGRQVRTMTSAARAEARQSMDRTSSPGTYSRNESNSLPCPRTMTRVRPSSSRSRASFAGRCRLDRNGGSTRTRQGTTCEPCRAARPNGPADRTVTRVA